MLQINTTKAPTEGTILNVQTSKLPKLNSQVEVIKGKVAVAIGIVVNHTSSHTYQVLVVMSETGGMQ